MKVKRSQLYACISLGVLALIIGAAGFLMVVSPQQAKASKLDAEIAATQAKLVALHGRHRGPVIRAADLFQLARAMPDTADMPGIVLGLARAAQASSVKLTSITPGAAIAQPDGAQALPVNVIITGTWSGVTSFLRALRRDVTVNGSKLSASGRLFVIDSVQIAASGVSGADEVQATMMVNAFTYGVAPVVTVDTSTTSTSTTTTTATSSGSVQAAGSTG